MADLLECVIQIKALEWSIGRLERIVRASASAGGGEVEVSLAQLVEAERRFSTARQAVGPTPPSRGDHSLRPGPAIALDEWVALRRANLERFGACTAAELGAPVAWPGRSDLTLADLVAIMLAHDTDVMGRLEFAHRQRPSGR